MAAQERSFPIVGIGASAGGLAALQELLRFLPDDAGMAYVVVQHLAPKHESVLPDLLARATRMQVHEAREDMEVSADHVYVIAPQYGHDALARRAATSTTDRDGGTASLH
ncbi:MAG TPA: chemotaxis protein CheB [Ktedonobacteraceae bacterium]|nr:chemotaxis protein CheB [Ktedonobacteraceae bacterium]